MRPESPGNRPGKDFFMLIERRHSALLLVDVQEKLLPAMAAPESLLPRLELLLRGAARLGVPILASEQYRKGLGATVPALRALLPEGAVGEKLAFSCVADEGLRERITGLGRPQVVVAGIEAHVCVLQTALDLRRIGLAPVVVSDGVMSRRPADRETALARLGQAGVVVASSEMVVFEWLGEAGTPEFRDLIRLIR
jgi:nicotinamidase-related amidase